MDAGGLLELFMRAQQCEEECDTAGAAKTYLHATATLPATETSHPRVASETHCRKPSHRRSISSHPPRSPRSAACTDALRLEDARKCFLRSPTARTCARHGADLNLGDARIAYRHAHRRDGALRRGLPPIEDGKRGRRNIKHEDRRAARRMARKRTRTSDPLDEEEGSRSQLSQWVVSPRHRDCQPCLVHARAPAPPGGRLQRRAAVRTPLCEGHMRYRLTPELWPSTWSRQLALAADTAEPIDADDLTRCDALTAASDALRHVDRGVRVGSLTRVAVLAERAVNRCSEIKGEQSERRQGKHRALAAHLPSSHRLLQ